jgi:tetratricopeptide (TPR) repeat protein
MYQTPSDRRRWLETAITLVSRACPLATEASLHFISMFPDLDGDPTRVPLVMRLTAELALSLVTEQPQEALRLTDYLTRAGYPDRLGMVAGARGVALKNLGRWREAEEVLRRQVEALRQHRIPRLLGVALGNYATVCLLLDRNADAQKTLGELERIHAQLGDLYSRALTLSRLTSVALAASEHLKARRYCEECLRIIDQFAPYQGRVGGDHRATALRGVALNDLGLVYQDLARWQAECGDRWAHLVSEEARGGERLHLPIDYYLAPELVWGAGEFRTLCLQQFRAAFDLSAEQGDRLNQAVALRNLGSAQKEFGSVSEAVDSLRQAAALLKGSPVTLAGLTHWDLSLALDTAGEHWAALREGREALRHLRGTDHGDLAWMRTRQLARWLMCWIPGISLCVSSLWWLWRLAGYVLAGKHVLVLIGQSPHVSASGLATTVLVWLVLAGCLSALSRWLGRARAGESLVESRPQFRLRRNQFTNRFLSILLLNVFVPTAVGATGGLTQVLPYAIAFPIVSGAVLMWPDWLGLHYRQRLTFTLIFLGVLMTVGLAAGTVAGQVRDWAGPGWVSWLGAALAGAVAGIQTGGRKGSGGCSGLLAGGILGAAVGGMIGSSLVSVALAIPAALLGGLIGAYVSGITGGVWTDREARQEESNSS